MCDNCALWIHNDCAGISNSLYTRHQLHGSLSFICPRCNFPSFIRNLDTHILNDNNRFSVLSDLDPDSDQQSLPSINSEESFRPAPFSQSTPKKITNTHKANKELKVLSINCDSLQSFHKRSELKAIIAKNEPHLVLCQETKLGDQHLHSELFPDGSGWSCVRKDRKTGAGGVMILIREGIDFNEDALKTFETDCEIVWIQLKLPGTKLLNVASVYRPPGSSIGYITKLQKHMHEIYSKYRNASYIICGDLNLTSVDWEYHTVKTESIEGVNREALNTGNKGGYDQNHCSAFLELLRELGLTQHVLEVTRDKSNKILDLVLTNRPDNLLTTSVEPGMSDHNVVIATFDLAPNRKKCHQRKILKYDKADWNKIRNRTKSMADQYFLRSPDELSVDINCKFIEHEIKTIIDEEIPSKVSKARVSYPWITPEVKKALRIRDRLYKKAKRSKSPHMWNNFKQARQRAKKVIRSSHASYISKTITTNLHSNQKPFWSYIRSLRKNSNTIPSLQAKNNILATTNQSKADALVDQFTSVFAQEGDEGPRLQQLFPDMPAIEVGEEGVRKLLSSINPSKAGGPDGIPARFLKEAANELAPIYTQLFQQSYVTGELPKSWTHAIVAPIFKKGKKSLPVNYRPVSLTAIPCKVFEHILVSKIWLHLNNHNIITTKQHGFRGGLSCETQLIGALDDWTRVMDWGGGQVDAIVLDFSKAFDVVPHNRLSSKLACYGITGHTGQWIKSFLRSRTHQVVVNGSMSRECGVSSGVPQGTVLGPLLFLIFINDIEDGLRSQIRLFADDSILYREIVTEEDSHILQRDLFKLQEWSDKWMMRFNVEKCKTLRLTRRTKHRVDFQYLMSTPGCGESVASVPLSTLESAKDILNTIPFNGRFQALEVIASDKYLGVILDSKLTFNQHVESICAKATRILNLCRRNLSMCPPATREIAYKALVRPQLEYASTAWNPHTLKNITKLENVQRRAARWVLGNYTYGPNAQLTEEIANKLRWQSLQHRRAISDICMFYKIRNNIVTIEFPPTVKQHYRDAFKYQSIQANHSEAYKNGFYPRSVRLWNQLPIVLRESLTIESFRNGAATWIAPLAWSRAPATGVWRPT